jgi:nicotinamidase-related amidase
MAEPAADLDLDLDPAHTALVVVDLQRGIVAMDTEPHAADDVVERSARLATALRAAGGFVVFVRVSFAADGADALTTPTDTASPARERPAGWDELVPELGREDADIVVTKRNWGAFHGTDLDVQLRRRGIDTVVVTGIATNMGVESTARAAHEHGYAVVIAEDASASMDADMHRFAVERIFPRLGRVRSTDEIVAALS